MYHRLTMRKLPEKDLRAEHDRPQERWKKTAATNNWFVLGEITCFPLRIAGIHQSARSGRGFGLYQLEKAERAVFAGSAVCGLGFWIGSIWVFTGLFVCKSFTLTFFFACPNTIRNCKEILCKCSLFLKNYGTCPTSCLW